MEDGKVTLTIGPAMPAKKPPQTIFGKRLVALRKARRLTQVQLAEKLGTTQRVISYYETDAELPPSTAIVALARALNVTADQLLGLKPAKIDEEKNPSRRLWKRFQRMAALPERDQRAVLRLINSLSAARGSEAQAS